MLRSMTGFGRGELDTESARYIIELQSINRKHLDISLNLPREFSRFEGDFRKWIHAAITRGHVIVRVFVSFKNTTPLSIRVQLPLALQVKHALTELAHELRLDTTQLDVTTLIKTCPSIISFDENWQDEDRYRGELKGAFDKAMQNLMTMKENEGVALTKDIQIRLEKLKSNIQQIHKLSPDSVNKQRQKLAQRLEEFLPTDMETDERILREIALYAEKVDVSEEIARFNSHLDQLDDLVKSKEPAIGKTFEFLLQELLRETNTIGSKALDVNVTKLVVDNKSEIEKLKEQIQNVE